MEIELVFRLIFLNVCALTYSIRSYYSVKIQSAPQNVSRSKKWVESVKYEGKVNVILRTVLAPLWVLALVLFFISPLSMPWPSLPFPSWLRWTGVAVAILCLPFLIWVQHTLGRQWSTHLRLREDHRLVVNGPYKWVRHPMYVVLFLFLLSVGLATASPLIAVMNILLIAVFYRRISKEEKMMIERFGNEYSTYMKRTGRFWPVIKRSGKPTDKNTADSLSQKPLA